METLVFHSVKGGVGRTLALANLGVALARAGKKVLMLDFDYEAPGLHCKFEMPPYPGYIDYLREVGLEQRCRGASGGHGDHLLKKIRKLDIAGVECGTGELHLLGAGDETQKQYWGFLASNRFHSLFYYTEAEISGLTNLAFPKENLGNNRRAFEGDLELIRERFRPDYLLVDCKTGREENAFALLFWSDRIAHFFPHNMEGSSYALEIARSIARFRLRERRTIGFVPVVSRVPDDFAEGEKKLLRQEMMEEWDFDDVPFFQPDDFVFLSELRDMETKERLLVNADSTSHDRRWLLAHDQLELFSRLAPLKETVGTDQPIDAWYKTLDMDKNDKQFLKTFIHRPHLGTMLNIVDGQPNIAFRVRTLHLMYQTLLKSADDGTGKVYEALRRTGYAAGKDFADEFADKHQDGDFLYRLKRWADFDSGVGFGQIEIVENGLSVAPLSGTIRVDGDAFHRLPDGNGIDEKQDLRGIFVGYVQAVIEKLSGVADVLVKAEDDAPSPQKNTSLYTFKDNKQ